MNRQLDFWKICDDRRRLLTFNYIFLLHKQISLELN